MGEPVLSSASLFRVLNILPVDAVLSLFVLVLHIKRAEVEEIASTLREARLNEEEIERIVANLNDPRSSEKTAAISESARRAILTVEMLDTTSIATALRLADSESGATVLSLFERGTLLGLPSPLARSYVFPAFQVDRIAARLRPTVAAINLALGAANDPWGVASWWVSRNPRLAGAKPMDLLGTDSENDLLTLAGLHPSIESAGTGAVDA
ncbi:hypothetical protein [Actinoplanes sp. NPDC049681]|uniref:hypothetical protein n=1 Tax=Actinoplanes sp. NPDC049681 TaxID=3363905 RepID=UPI0037B991B0